MSLSSIGFVATGVKLVLTGDGVWCVRCPANRVQIRTCVVLYTHNSFGIALGWNEERAHGGRGSGEAVALKARSGGGVRKIVGVWVGT